MNDIKFRASRRWQINLAKKLGFSCNNEKESNVKVNDLTIVERLKKVNKILPLPSVEWLIDVSPKLNSKSDLFIETGSRLFKTDKNYICYVENGLGLFSYNTKKNNKFNRKLIISLINKNNFKGFLFYSKATEKSFLNLFVNNSEVVNKSLGVIYPYTTEKYYKYHTVINKRVGFCSSNFYLKGGSEILDVARKMPEIKFDIITKIEGINKEDILSAPSNVNFIEFNLTENEFMVMARDQWDIYLHPTFFDTVPVAPIEMIKCGLPIITTDTYAIPEYVLKYNTGVIIKNPKNPFDSKFLPYSDGYLGETLDMFAVKNDAKEDNVITELVLAINKIYDNYSIYQDNLKKFVFNSEFSESYILNKWNDVLNPHING
ncbi:TPA: glycosyltransferase [Photobacterium damselae]